MHNAKTKMGVSVTKNWSGGGRGLPGRSDMQSNWESCSR